MPITWTLVRRLPVTSAHQNIALCYTHLTTPHTPHPSPPSLPTVASSIMESEAKHLMETRADHIARYRDERRRQLADRIGNLNEKVTIISRCSRKEKENEPFEKVYSESEGSLSKSTLHVPFKLWRAKDTAMSKEVLVRYTSGKSMERMGSLYVQQQNNMNEELAAESRLGDSHLHEIEVCSKENVADALGKPLALPQRFTILETQLVGLPPWARLVFVFYIKARLLIQWSLTLAVNHPWKLLTFISVL